MLWFNSSEYSGQPALFVSIDSLHPNQLFFSHVGTGLPVLNPSTKQKIKCLAQGHNVMPPVRTA